MTKPRPRTTRRCGIVLLSDFNVARIIRPLVPLSRWLVPFVHCENEIAFGDLKPRLELASVLDLVRIDLGSAAHRLNRVGLAIEMIPALGIVQPAHHVDTVSGRCVNQAARPKPA